MKQTLLNLTGLEIFFIITTLVSFFFNLYQLMISRREKQSLQIPLTNILAALFNDVKSKTNSVYGTQQFLFHPKSPHKEIETLRWEFWRFAEAVIDSLRGFQEALVGALITLNPKDRDGKLVFRSADYGLTEDEKKVRDEYIKRSQAKPGFGIGKLTNSGKD